MRRTRYSTMTNEELARMVQCDGGYGELAEELVERLIETMPTVSGMTMNSKLPKSLQSYFAASWYGDDTRK